MVLCLAFFLVGGCRTIHSLCEAWSFDLWHQVYGFVPSIFLMGAIELSRCWDGDCRLLELVMHVYACELCGFGHLDLGVSLCLLGSYFLACTACSSVSCVPYVICFATLLLHLFMSWWLFYRAWSFDLW
jgi:hypothetical protein